MPHRFNLPSSSTHASTMEGLLFDSFDVCGASILSAKPEQEPPLLSCTAALFASMSRKLIAWLPRRVHEPRGPTELIMDMLLGIFVPRGASRGSIAAIPTAVVQTAPTDVENGSLATKECDKCAICLAPYEQGDVVRNLACCHRFHVECVDSWLERRSLCPVCKADAC